MNGRRAYERGNIQAGVNWQLGEVAHQGACLEGTGAQAERIRREIAYLEFEQVGRVTVSFGLARYRENDTADSFLKRADEAMYKVKTDGKNRVETVD